jgi:UDP-glucose 4-epimerase
MAVDPAPARDGLGWHPRTDLPTGLKITVEWVRNHAT